MNQPKLSDLIGIIHKISPPRLAEVWDNPGLQVGDPEKPIKKIMLALEPTDSVINSAISFSADLLVTHHPLIFKPQKSISTSTPLGRIIHKSIASNLSILSIHTNYDAVAGGLNDTLASLLGIREVRELIPAERNDLLKLAVFIPMTHSEQVRSALAPFSFAIGNYSDCMFSAPGTGTFKPLEGANPFIGKAGITESVSEEKLELVIAKENLHKALKKLSSVHPYEEPAFNIYPIENYRKGEGTGRLGMLEQQIDLVSYARKVAEILKTDGVRFVGKPERSISKVALCSGSGAFLINAAARQGADLLVTGDVKYHDAREAEARNIAVIDAGHFATEIIMAEAVANRLELELAKAGFDCCEIMVCPSEKDPFIYRF